MLKNDLLIRAAKGEQTDRVPVWLMRQAGRILPEYRAIRESLSGFKELVETPDLAAEVTIQPVDILGVDAAIIFSDILVIPEAMGLPYTMVEKKGPYFEQTINSEADLKKLTSTNLNLNYVFDAIKETKKRLDGRVPLIGFAGAPWTILCYMIEGSGSKTFSKPRGLLYKNPKMAHQLLEMITESTIAYLKEQVKAGADVLQIFDSWAGILDKKQYAEFGIRYINRICEEIDEVPITVFSKGANFSLGELKDLDCRTIGLDWHVDGKTAREIIGDEKTLQGNLDPCALYAVDDVLIQKVTEMLDEFGSQKYIANLGHGVYPDTDPEKVKLFIDTVKKHKFHQ
ncbi:MAG: uroporphyrinogen decarboxylase [Cyclobacteriaceae bacterium]|nr:uroporphyrinogen decarboxylase [Cyclobacteriaceae bacterium]